MKKISIFLMLLISTVSFSQEIKTSEALTSQEYLERSRTQKVFGVIFLGAGVTTLALISKGNVSLDVLPTLAIGGIASTLGSIPFFISSARNKKRSKNATVNLNLKPIIIKVDNRYSSYTAVSVRVKY